MTIGRISRFFVVFFMVILLFRIKYVQRTHLRSRDYPFFTQFVQHSDDGLFLLLSGVKDRAEVLRPDVGSLTVLLLRVVGIEICPQKLFI